MNRRVSFFLLLAFCCFALFWRLGSYGLTEPDEGRTAGIGLEFYQSGTWLIPRLYDLAQFNKPPLIYWACSLAYRIGGVNEWTARLPAALAALGTLLLTRAMARRLYGDSAALAATLILLTAPMFFVMAHIIDPNMMLTFWITLTMWAAIAWFQDGKKYQRWIFWIALGIAFLAKGPPAILVTGLALAGLRWLPPRDGAHSRLLQTNEVTPENAFVVAAHEPRSSSSLPWRSLLNVPAILVCIAIALSWFIAVATKYPELWKFFIGQEIVGRLTGGKLGRSQPPYYFIPILLGGFLPWLPLFIASLVDAASKFKTDARARLLICWVLLPFLMFSLTKSKLPAYILPLFPPLAMLMGAEAARKYRFRWFRAVQILFAIIVPVLLVGALEHYGANELPWIKGFMLIDRVWFWILVVALIVSFFVPESESLLAVAVASVLTILCYLSCVKLVSFHDNELGAQSSPWKMCKAMKPLLQSSDRVAIFKNAPRGVNFYLQHPLSFSDKYEPQLDSDWKLLADRLYKDEDANVVYRWFDSEPRVFVITTDRKRGGEAGTDKSPLDFLKENCRKPVREIYRDDKYIVVCNFPQP